MHRVWLVNLEEVLAQRPSREHLCQQFCRYLHMVKPGDLFIHSLDLPRDYVEYVRRMRKLPDPQEWLLKIDFHIPYSICDCIQRNRKVMDILGQAGRKSEYVLEPYIDSPSVVELSAKTGVQYAGLRKGLTKKLNDKSYFREISAELGIDIAPGFSARTQEELAIAVKELCPNSTDRAILKKTFSGGGFGNLAGSRDELLAAIPYWFDGSEYVVEKLLNLEITVGAVGEIRDDEFVFDGLDCQIIENFGWRGCSFPFKLEGVSQEIEKRCRQYADRFHEQGARGFLNIDWGLERQANGELKIFAIEINFRHNGFSFALNLAREYFVLPADDLNLLFYYQFEVGDRFRNFAQLVELAERVKLDGVSVFSRQGGLRNGFVFVNPLKEGVVGLLIAGESRVKIDSIETEIKAAIGCKALR
jgi:hypothetical protein